MESTRKKSEIPAVYFLSCLTIFILNITGDSDVFPILTFYGMKEKIAIVYDTSAQKGDAAEKLKSRLALPAADVMHVSALTSAILSKYDVLLLLSTHWSDAVLPGEWLRLSERIEADRLTGRTFVPISLSSPLSISAAPALRRMMSPVCVRIVSAVEAAFISESHCATHIDNCTAPDGHKVANWKEVFYSDIFSEK